MKNSELFPRRLSWIGTLPFVILVLLCAVWSANVYSIWARMGQDYSFVGMLLYPAVFFIALYGCVMAIRIGASRATSIVVVICSVGSIAVLVFVPNQEAFRDKNFEENLIARERVIASYLAGENRVLDRLHRFEVTDLAVAAGGWVHVHERENDTLLIFPVLLWWIDNHSAFVYSTSGEPPSKHSFHVIVSTERIDDNWFWISTT